ncbi:MAG TPA: M20 family metallopeptidase [Candidatus Limiplasma sp.]|nr:M20 family metallopeptidase [Candidatus Limiplasma sp.]
MNTQKAKALEAIDHNQETILNLSDAIWDYAELSLMEFKSAALYVKTLRELGFTVEEGIAGIPTAFSASFGSGKPVLGILAEYDALSGLSQAGMSTERKERVKGGSGHGCGHNMLGAGALAAAIAVKQYLQDNDTSGTVIFYGCPGEEGGAGKAFMAREGLWKKLDAALTWHPDGCNEITTGTCNSCIQTEYRFTGVAAHAAGNPHQGRSGLDAVQLMNLGVEFLREHMPTTGRIHYAITDAGGASPNVVQPYAKVLYMVRDIQVGDALKLQERVDKIAQGAALMTETKLTSRFIDGTANLVPNFTLETLMYDNFAELGTPSYTQEETAFARALRNTYPTDSQELPGFGPQNDETIADQVRKLSDNGQKPINDFLNPLYHSRKFSFGSTDVGDVSWQTPTVQCRAATYPSLSPGHSWQNVSCGVSGIAHKGLLQAGKVIAATAIDLFENPEILRKAKAEFKEKAAAGYQCPIPPDAKPTAIDTEF